MCIVQCILPRTQWLHHHDSHSHSSSGCRSVLQPTDFSVTPVLNCPQFQGTTSPDCSSSSPLQAEVQMSSYDSSVASFPKRSSCSPLCLPFTLSCGQQALAMVTLTVSGSCLCWAPGRQSFCKSDVPSAGDVPSSDCNSIVISSEVTGQKACYKLRHVVLYF